MFSTRAHCPIVLCHPMMLPDTQACFLMRTPRMTVQRDRRTPLSMMQPCPMATSGPIRQPSPICAVSSTTTLPTTCGPVASISGHLLLCESRYRRRPAAHGRPMDAVVSARRFYHSEKLYKVPRASSRPEFRIATWLASTCTPCITWSHVATERGSMMPALRREEIASLPFRGGGKGRLRGSGLPVM
ncbi:hypothetical protein Mapa_000525 [Marchantia paleacea]|nr:hypothetical protein Mapa_000525 [Marchantia paleacea]